MSGVDYGFAFLLLIGAHSGTWNLEGLGPGLEVRGLPELRQATGLSVIALDKPIRRPVRHGRHVAAQATTAAAVKAALPVLSAELRLYPPGFFHAATLRRIVLCGALVREVEGEKTSAGGLACYDQGTIFVALPDSRWGASSLRNAIHHEVFHLLDLNTAWGGASDREWVGVNEPGFRYLGRQPDTDAINPEGRDEAPAGFVSSYAASDVLEDKAETFAHLVTLPWHIRERSAKDSVLRRKAILLKERLARHPYRLDAGFWAIAEVRPRSSSVSELIAAKEDLATRAAAELFYNLAGSSDRNRPAVLKQMEAIKGEEWNLAMAFVASRLRPVPEDVRDMLARRLKESSAAKLADYLADRGAPRELRLAAAKAAAHKGGDPYGVRVLARRLIGALSERDEDISRESVSSLRRLTGQDFGPNKTRWVAWIELEWDV